jgi:predicted outer membrane repeat protein
MRKLALQGGVPIRQQAMPNRGQFGRAERDAANAVFDFYEKDKIDHPYQGHFEELYCSQFIRMMGKKGYCDVVSSGTAALFVSLQALELKSTSLVGTTAITDPGAVSAIALLGHKITIFDSAPQSVNTSLQQIKDAFSDNISAIVVTHTAGKAIEDIDAIAKFLKEQNIYLIEDCSQAHGAIINGKRVGTFGDIAIFSTMFSKNHSTGSTGGVIYTQSTSLFKKLRSYSDRGKDFFDQNFDQKDPASFAGPALNFNSNEIACSIGCSTLKKLDQTNKKRVEILDIIADQLVSYADIMQLYTFSKQDAPFYWPVLLNTQNIQCSKLEFAKAIAAEGISINIDYKYIITEWPWAQKFLNRNFTAVNAINFRDTSFNLLFHENYKDKDVIDVINAFKKVSDFYKKINKLILTSISSEIKDPTPLLRSKETFTSQLPIK